MDPIKPTKQSAKTNSKHPVIQRLVSFLSFIRKRHLIYLLVLFSITNCFFLFYVTFSKDDLSSHPSEVQVKREQSKSIISFARVLGKVLLSDEETNSSDCQPKARLKISEFNFRTPTQNRCERENVSIFYAIYSSWDRRKYRDAIRKGWAKQGQSSRGFAYVFVIERTSNHSKDTWVISESEKCGDILFTSWPTYQTNTQLIRALPWILECCKYIPYIAELTDTMFVHTARVNSWLLGSDRRGFAVGKMTENFLGKELAHNDRNDHSMYTISKIPRQPENAANDGNSRSGPFAMFYSKDIAKVVVNIIDASLSWNVFRRFSVQQNSSLVYKEHPLIYVTNSGHNLSVCELQTVLTSSVNTAHVMEMYGMKLDVWSKYINCPNSRSKLRHERKDQNPFSEESTSKLANKFPVKFPLNHPHWCQTVFATSQPPHILAMVISAPNNFEARKAIRETWGKNSDQSDDVKSIFLLGQVEEGSDVQSQIFDENNRYKDIIMGNFFDDYYNLTIKTFALIQWTHEYCPQAKYVIKVDDDAFLNSPALAKKLKDSPRSKFYFGDPYVGTRPVRDISSKWYTPEEAWNDTVYPPYHAGFSYVISSDVISDIYNFRDPIDVIPWEDTMMGILISKLGDVTAIPDKRVDTHGVYRHPCSLRDSLLVHHFTPGDLRKYWQILYQMNACAESERNYTKIPHKEEVIRTEQGSREEQTQFIVRNEKNDVKVYCDKETYLVVFVFSEAANYERRKYARLTWAKTKYTNNGHVKISFVLPKTTKKSLTNFVNNEVAVEGDIITVNTDFIFSTDDLTNSPWSGVQQLRLLDELQRHFCPNVKYVMKTEDDVFVNLVNVVTFIKKSIPSHIIVGRFRNLTKETGVGVLADNNVNNRFETRKAVFIIPSTLLHETQSGGRSKDTQPLVTRVHSDIVIDSYKNEQNEMDICNLYNLLATQVFEGGIMLQIARAFHGQIFFNNCNTNGSDVMMNAFRPYSLSEKIPEIHTLFNDWLYERKVDSFEYEFVINQPRYCQDTSSDIFLLVTVLSDPREFELRSAIRATWLKQSNFDGKIVKHLFLVGKNGDHKVNEKVREENGNYGDVIQIDIIDDFKNATLKTVMTFKWFCKFCSNAKFLLQVRSYIFIHLQQVVMYLGNLRFGTDQLVIGNVRIESKPVRHPKHIYYTPHELYPQETYPSYPLSRSCVMSSKVVHKLLQASLKTALFPWEDVYVGMLLQRAGVTPHSHPDFVSYSLSTSSDVCKLQSFMSWKIETIEQVYQFWNTLTDDDARGARGKCPKPKRINMKGDNFLIVNNQICNVDTLDLLLVVISRPDNTRGRQSIRDTWAMSSRMDGEYTNVRHIFVMARTQSRRQLDDIITEAREFGDVMLLDFDDIYDNLVFKSLMAMKWVSLFCPKVKYVMKVDDDVFVNTIAVLKFLKTAPRNDLYLGYTYHYQEPMRDKKNRNYTPYTLWPEKLYPPYNAGPAYIMSANVVLNAYQSSFGAFYLNNEDVFVGALLQRIGVFPIHDRRFDIVADVNKYQDSAIFDMFALHSVQHKHNYRYWYHVWNNQHYSQHGLRQKYRDSLNVEKHSNNFNLANKADKSAANPSICRQDEISLLILVDSNPFGFQHRQAIRDTWARTNSRVRIAFIIDFISQSRDFLSQSHDKTSPKMISYLDEQAKYDDMIEMCGNLTSDYSVSKILLALQWVDRYCQHAQYIMLTNHDTYVMLDNVLHLLRKSRDTSTVIGRRRNVPLSAPLLDHSVDVYLDPVKYSWAHSDVVIMSRDMVGRILSTSEKMQFPFSSAYMALLMNELKVGIEDNSDFDMEAERRPLWLCSHKTVLVSTYFTPQQIYRQYEMTGVLKDCPNPDNDVNIMLIIIALLLTSILYKCCARNLGQKLRKLRHKRRVLRANATSIRSNSSSC